MDTAAPAGDRGPATWCAAEAPGARGLSTSAAAGSTATGLPPGEWLQQERLRLAQQLLETRNEPMTVIARKAGYDSETTMRAQFASRLGTSPRAYRQTFGGPSAAGEA